MPASVKIVVAYGLLAAVLLGCLFLISLAPLSLDWGRELLGAAIAIVALAVGLRLSRGRERVVPAVAAPMQAADDSVAEDAPTLSARERQILELLADGLSNKQIARTLSLSQNTIKTHLGHLYSKLGVGRRTEALAAARRCRLLRG